MKILVKLLESYVIVLILALFLGLTFPDLGLYIVPASTLFLQIIFFLSSLKLDVRALATEAKRTKIIVLVNFYMLILFPAAVFLLAKFLAPQYALPLLLLAAMPAGMTSPLLSEIVGGSVGFALVLTMITSLFAPITIPLMIKLLAGASVAVPIMAMFKSLFFVIVVPFALAQAVRFFFHEKIKATFFTFKPISILLLGLLIFGIVAKRAGELRTHLGLFLGALAVLSIFFLLLHLIGYWGVPGLARAERLSATICLTYMNFTLAIFLAGKFFPQPEVLIPVILSVFPWSIGIIPFKFLANRRQKHIA